MKMKIRLSSIGEKIGGINLNSLEGRINFQKSIYLLKELGAIKEKFKFSWYIFGPYSPDVARIGFDLVERKIDTEISVSNDFESKIDQFKELIKTNSDESKWLELLATLHFMRKYEYPNLTKEEIFEKLVEHQPYYDNKELFERGWEFITSFFSF